MRDRTHVLFVTPDHYATQETSHLDRPFLLRRLYEGGATIMPDRRLIGVARSGNRLIASLANELIDAGESVACDRVIVENGTRPVNDVYDDLRATSINDGITDVDALTAGFAQDVVINPHERFRLYRVGDAVASRDIHAAILDSLRLCKDF